MKTLFLSTFLVINSIFGISLFNDENTRYPTLPDIHDTTSWNDSYSLTANQSYSAVFKHYFDSDYYVFNNNQHIHPVALYVTSSNQTANIVIYDSNFNVLKSYNSLIAHDYANFAEKLITVFPNVTIYIKVSATTTASYYSIIANTNPNLSGVSIIGPNSSDHTVKFNHYYGQNPSNVTGLKYKISSNCDVFIGSSGYTISDAYEEAVYFWHRVGRLNLTLATNNYDILLNCVNSSLINESDSDSTLGYAHPVYETNFFGIRTGISFDYVYVLNDSNAFVSYTSNDILRYKYYVYLCIHEIGHTLGLYHYNVGREMNYMFYLMNSGCYYNDEIGDGDYASYQYLWG